MLNVRALIATIGLTGLVIAVLIANLSYPPEPKLAGFSSDYQLQIFPVIRLEPTGEVDEPLEEREVHEEFSPKVRKAEVLSFKERFSPQ